ncbi:MAG: class I SAM-dependent methyltransferase [Chromatiales bacterium]|nr:class I SAM-dependent methyltransferase [Chromatiales bacterium]
MTTLFNRGNADLNNFVLETLALEGTDRVLEIGFGPGRLISHMAKVIDQGIIEGVDFSQTMLQQAARVNQAAIKAGRVRLHEGECSALPFEDNHFDKLCSVNTLYFWREPNRYLTEMCRVLKPGGKIVIGFRDDEQMRLIDLSDQIFSSYSQQEVVSLLESAGFSKPHIVAKEGEPFISYCAVAIRAC